MISMLNDIKFQTKEIKKTSFLLKMIKNSKVTLKVKTREITSNILIKNGRNTRRN